MCWPLILQGGKLKLIDMIQCVLITYGRVVAESMLVPFLSTSVTSHSMKGFPLKGDGPHFFLMQAKRNQSPRSAHWVSIEASPFINVIPWEIISSTDNRKNKYFC